MKNNLRFLFMLVWIEHDKKQAKPVLGNVMREKESQRKLAFHVSRYPG